MADAMGGSTARRSDFVAWVLAGVRGITDEYLRRDGSPLLPAIMLSERSSGERFIADLTVEQERTPGSRAWATALMEHLQPDRIALPAAAVSIPMAADGAWRQSLASIARRIGRGQKLPFSHVVVRFFESDWDDTYMAPIEGEGRVRRCGSWRSHNERGVQRHDAVPSEQDQAVVEAFSAWRH